ncbi:TPA: lysozyme [Enterobacter hormaechei subsp. oharae]|nr:lysozyme [Enterobacter hormaechei subsp. oharae]HDT2502964.1 lysozyme [Enterobacter hormaechei subsp. oharae]
MEMSNNGINMLKSFEGCRLAAYQDSVGVWTIGYGWTQPVNGVPVGKGMTITQDTADSLLRSGLVQYEKGVTGLVKVTINQNQFDALVDFAYNLGVKALEGSTLLKKLNAGDYAGAAAEFPKWNKAGGKVLPGLVKRREAERTLFLA